MPIDVEIPSWLRQNRPSDPRGEPAVNAWGPFQVWLEDADVQPAYVGSRLTFRWDRLSGTRQVSFFPIGESMKVYTLTDDTWPASAYQTRVLCFRTLEHGWMEVQPVPDDQLDDFLSAGHLVRNTTPLPQLDY